MRYDDTRFTGSWRVMLSSAAGSGPLLMLGTLGADGTVVTSPPAVEPFPLHPSGIVHVSTAHGAWEPTGEDTAVMSFVGQASVGDGSLAGIGTFDARLRLGSDDDSLEGTYEFAMTDAAGLVFATEQGAITAMRIAATASAMASR